MKVNDATTAEELAEEDLARANIYGLLGRLFAQPADADLLQGIAASMTDKSSPAGPDGEYVRAWNALVAAARVAVADKVNDEFHTLFVGAGRADISLYVGAYSARSGVDSLLVRLRQFLHEHGMQRQTGVHEPEDHVAMVFETMRYLISDGCAPVEVQRSFFERFVMVGSIQLCDAICAHQRADFYVPVAKLAKTFLHIESEAFSM